MEPGGLIGTSKISGAIKPKVGNTVRLPLHIKVETNSHHKYHMYISVRAYRYQNIETLSDIIQIAEMKLAPFFYNAMGRHLHWSRVLPHLGKTTDASDPQSFRHFSPSEFSLHSSQRYDLIEAKPAESICNVGACRYSGVPKFALAFHFKMRYATHQSPSLSRTCGFDAG